MNLVKKMFAAVSAFTLLMTALLLTSLLLNGCGSSSGEPSSQVLSGTAAVGTPLSGQVSLKDSSSPTQTKTTVIGPNGSFSFDVTNMTAPFILQADGHANGKSYKLHSFSEGSGTANVNPLTDVLVVSSCVDEDPAAVFSHPDAGKLEKIKSRIDMSTADLLEKLNPLFRLFNAGGKDPIKDHFIADHNGLDGVFDYVNISIVDGILTITNKESGAIIFTGSITDIKGGHFTDNDEDLPHPVAVSEAPDDLEAAGGAGQVTLTWESVSNATSYNIYYASTPGVTVENGTKISNVTTPYVQTGLTANSSYYYIVTAVNSAGESEISDQASATTDASQPIATVPAAPGGVFATGGTKQVTVVWNNVSNATSYNIYYSASNSGVTKANGILIANVTSPAVLADLTAGITYYYIVTAVNSAGEGSPSVQVAAMTLTDVPPTPTIPGAPGSVTSTGSALQATINWAAVSGATSYNLYWSTTTGVTKANGTKVAGISSPYTKTGLSAGTIYYFIVTAVNSAGESVASSQTAASTDAPAVAVPGTPTNVTPLGGDKQVSLSWSAVSGATSYNIYWATTSGVTTANTRITTTGTSYVQTGLAVSTTYYYIVTAVNASGQSVASAQVNAKTSAAVVVLPSAPATISALGGAKQVSVTWGAVAGATSYNLYWSTTSGTAFAGTKITNVASPYALTGLADSATIYTIVTAVNSAGEGAASAQANATTNAATLVCGTCHSIPPTSGAHTYHVSTRRYGCDRCHGTGYSASTIVAATHDDGTVNLANSITGWTASTNNCTTSCHGSRTW